MEGINDLEFSELLKEKRFNKIISVLSNILENIEKFNSEEITNFVNNTVLKKEDGVLANRSLEIIGNNIVLKLEELNKKQQIDNWQFDIQRDNNGYIKSINAKSKI